MDSSRFVQEISRVPSAYDELKHAADGDYGNKAKALKDVVKAASAALLELQSLSTIPARSYLDFQRACDKLSKTLEKETGYTEDEKKAVDDALGIFLAEAEKIQDMNTAVGNASRPEPLLPRNALHVLGWAVLALVLLGASLAACGVGKRLPACTVLSHWCAFASIALAIVWLLGHLSLHMPSIQFRAREFARPNVQYLIFGGMAFLVLGLLAAGVLTGSLLEFLSSTPGARGLITFLIAIGTIAIAVILTLASVVMEAKDENMLKERLSKGKEILTVLVGVLGTIVGFYFASNSEGPVGGKMTVSVVDAPTSVAPGQEFSVLAFTTGGQLPYDAAPIITVNKGIESQEGSVNEQGVIHVKFKVGADVSSATIPFEVGARDKAGKTATSKSDINVVAKNAEEKKQS